MRPLIFGIPFEALLRHRVRRCAAELDGAPDDRGAFQMGDPNAGLPPRYLRTAEAARFLSLSGRTLEKHRTYGTGPAYRKIGGRVVYALDDLKAWADRGTKTSTSDPGAGTVLPAKRHAPVPYAGKERR
jgi:Helix-turn-helix domain